MKATLGQIKIAIESGALGRLANASLPVKTAYWLGRTIDAADSEAARIEKQRVELIKKHGQEGDEAAGGGWEVMPESLVAYMSEFSELLSESVEITGHELTLDELEGVKLSGVDLIQLRWLVVAEADEAMPASVSQIGDKRKKKAQAAA